MTMAHRKNHQQQGFSLRELLIVMLILGILVVVVGPALWSDRHSISKPDASKTQMSNIEVGLDSYRLDMFQYPDSLEALVKNDSNDPKWKGPYLKNGVVPKDPWGNQYQYHKPGREGREYDLYSFGADGQEGGEGEQADVLSWQTD